MYVKIFRTAYELAMNPTVSIFEAIQDPYQNSKTEQNCPS